jgi:ribosomal protein S18 acetylase RimI-like enzyme
MKSDSMKGSGGMTPYTIKELSPDTWPDFERLTPQQGQCWCMYYHRARPVTRGMTREQATSRNKRDKKALVRNGKSHATLVYDGKNLAGWCQYGPKEELPRIDAGRNYKKLDPLSSDQRLWRITCFYVDRNYRKQGVARAALKGALDSIKSQGGGIVEAYPVVSKKMAVNPEWLWFGTPRMFLREKFKQVARLGTSLSLMRRTIK